MGVTKRIVCLANSRMERGHCIAGKDLTEGRPGAWIRPVNSKHERQLRTFQIRCEGGELPKPLDILEIPLDEPFPHSYQTEDWLIEHGRPWAKVGEYPFEDLDQLIDSGEELWRNGSSSSHGLNDRLNVWDVINTPPKDSLRLIFVSDLICSKAEWVDSKGRRHQGVRGDFSWKRVHYNFAVTDPILEERVRNQGVSMPCLRGYLTISLGEGFRGYVYKLIAALIQQP